MTKEELIKKYNSLENECNELGKKINNLSSASRKLIAENVKNLLGVEAGDIIFEKSSGDTYRIYDIFIQDNEIRLSLEYCGMVDYGGINDEEFLSNYMTESQWKELGKKKIKDNEYQEYLRLKYKKADYHDLLQEYWLRSRNSGKIKWKTKSGNLIPIKDMSDEHLKNAITHLQNKADLEDFSYIINN